MGLKNRTITPSLLRKYTVLRYLYLGPKTAQQLIEACPEMDKRHIITAIGNLLTNHAIRKERIPMDVPKATDEFFNEGSENVKMKHQYVLTSNGLRKIAYLEWKHQLYTHWKSPWSDSFNEPYYEEMKRIIIEDLKLPCQ